MEEKLMSVIQKWYELPNLVQSAIIILFMMTSVPVAIIMLANCNTILRPETCL